MKILIVLIINSYSPFIKQPLIFRIIITLLIILIPILTLIEILNHYMIPIKNSYFNHENIFILILNIFYWISLIYIYKIILILNARWIKNVY